MQKITGISFRGKQSFHFEFGQKDLSKDVLTQFNWQNNSRTALDEHSNVRVLMQNSTLGIFTNIPYTDVVNAFQNIDVFLDANVNTNKSLVVTVQKTQNQNDNSVGHVGAKLIDSNEGTYYDYDFGSVGHNNHGIKGYLSFIYPDKCHVNYDETEPTKKTGTPTISSLDFAQIRTNLEISPAIHPTEMSAFIDKLEEKVKESNTPSEYIKFFVSDEEYSQLEDKLNEIYQKCESGEVGYSFTRNLPNTETCVSSVELLTQTIGIANTFQYFADNELDYNNSKDQALLFAFYTKYLNREESVFQNILDDLSILQGTILENIITNPTLILVINGLPRFLSRYLNPANEEKEIIKSNFALLPKFNDLNEQCIPISDSDEIMTSLEIFGSFAIRKDVSKKSDGIYYGNYPSYLDCETEASDRDGEELFNGKYCIKTIVEELYFVKDSIEL